MATSTIAELTKAVRRARLKSALRTALACSIVGFTTLYASAHVRKFLAYPAFSYVTTILIVSDATVGDTLRGVWNAFYATTQVMLFSVLSLWLVGPARFTTPGVAAAMVSLGAFLVALPESTHLMSKRIAFGQMVIIYVGAAIGGANTGVVTHPVHVALSTALGALASVLALLFPYPWLACSEVNAQPWRVKSMFLNFSVLVQQSHDQGQDRFDCYCGVITRNDKCKGLGLEQTSNNISSVPNETKEMI